MVYRFSEQTLERFWGEIKVKVKKGNIIYLNKNIECGHLQNAENRPFLVVSNDIGNEFSEIIMVVPLTKSLKKLSQPTHTVISFNESMVLCEQIMSINKADIKGIYSFVLNDYQMSRVDDCLKNALGILR